MPAPTNVSLSGIIGWARTASVPEGTNPTGQDINADMVDGKHYADLKSEWETFAQSAGGGGVVAFGDSTFVGNGSYRTITFSPDLGAINYVVGVMPTADTNSYVGEIWWSRVSGTQFRVYNEGSGTTAFRWSVMVQGQMPDLAGTIPTPSDVTGTHPGPYTVARLQGRAVASTAPSTGQVLTWNGSSWAPGTVSGGGMQISVLTGVTVHSGYEPIRGATLQYLYIPGYATAKLFQFGVEPAWFSNVRNVMGDAMVLVTSSYGARTSGVYVVWDAPNNRWVAGFDFSPGSSTATVWVGY